MGSHSYQRSCFLPGAFSSVTSVSAGEGMELKQEKKGESLLHAVCDISLAVINNTKLNILISGSHAEEEKVLIIAPWKACSSAD